LLTGELLAHITASPRTFAAELEADGVPTSRSGSVWRPSTLVRVLGRESPASAAWLEGAPGRRMT